MTLPLRSRNLAGAIALASAALSWSAPAPAQTGLAERPSDAVKYTVSYHTTLPAMPMGSIADVDPATLALEATALAVELSKEVSVAYDGEQLFVEERLETAEAILPDGTRQPIPYRFPLVSRHWITRDAWYSAAHGPLWGEENYRLEVRHAAEYGRDGVAALCISPTIAEEFGLRHILGSPSEYADSGSAERPSDGSIYPVDQPDLGPEDSARLSQRSIQVEAAFYDQQQIEPNMPSRPTLAVSAIDPIYLMPSYVETRVGAQDGSTTTTEFLVRADWAEANTQVLPKRLVVAQGATAASVLPAPGDESPVGAPVGFSMVTLQPKLTVLNPRHISIPPVPDSGEVADYRNGR